MWTPRENRISGKNLVLEILSCLQIIFVSKFHFWMILSQILGFRPFSRVYFAYYDRQAWYLAGTGGPMVEKKFPGPNLGHLGQNFAKFSKILHFSKNKFFFNFSKNKSDKIRHRSACLERPFRDDKDIHWENLLNIKKNSKFWIFFKAKFT